MSVFLVQLQYCAVEVTQIKIKDPKEVLSGKGLETQKHCCSVRTQKSPRVCCPWGLNRWASPLLPAATVSPLQEATSYHTVLESFFFFFSF